MDVLVHVDDQSYTLRMMSLADNHSHFIMRTFTYDGQLVTRIHVPIFAREYVALYHVRRGYAVSPDGHSIAYLDKSTRALHILDLRSAKSRLVVPNLASHVAHLHTLEWTSNSKLLVAVDGTTDPYARLLVVDARSDAVCSDLRPPRLSLVGGVKTDGKYVAYHDVSLGHDGFRVYDLNERRNLDEIVPDDAASAGFEAWSSDGTSRFVWVERREGQQVLRQCRVADKEYTTLRSWTTSLTVSICGLVNSRLFYWLQPKDPSLPGALFMWDQANQEEVQVPGVGTWGSVRIADYGKRLIYEGHR